MFSLVTIMPAMMRTRSVGRPVAESQGGGTGNDQGLGANGGVEGVNGNVEGVNRGVGGAPDFSTIIAQQLQNLLPAILAQVGTKEMLEIKMLAPQRQKASNYDNSDLAPQRQEMSVENVSSGLVPQGQKASNYDNSDPVPPRQNVVPTAEKTDSSHQGLEFLFSPLLEEYYTPTQTRRQLATDPEMCMFALT
ncbi:hypothetical protein Tco_1579890, partial [Tanacetum coccineum]